MKQTRSAFPTHEFSQQQAVAARNPYQHNKLVFDRRWRRRRLVQNTPRHPRPHVAMNPNRLDGSALDALRAVCLKTCNSAGCWVRGATEKSHSGRASVALQTNCEQQISCSQIVEQAALIGISSSSDIEDRHMQSCSRAVVHMDRTSVRLVVHYYPVVEANSRRNGTTPCQLRKFPPS